MGISGGGWQTVMLAALIPEISTSISVSGTIPFPYKHLQDNLLGDWEDVYSPIYKEVSYFDLYQLMTLNQKGQKNRKAFIVYNRNEPFIGDPWSSHFKNYSETLSFLKYKVIINESDYHIMNVDLIKELVNLKKKP